MNTRAIKDLHYSWHLKNLSNCTRLKAGAILGEFSLKYHSWNKSLIVLVFIRLPVQTAGLRRRANETLCCYQIETDKGKLTAVAS